MDQVKVGTFLKQLRKEKGLTQEKAAEELRVSSRTISRWETGSNMPDISMLVELAAFYDVSISEIIDGERKSENMEEETKSTAIAMADYSHYEVKNAKKMLTGRLLIGAGLFFIIITLLIMPNDSSWGGIYLSLSGVLIIIGVGFIAGSIMTKLRYQILAIAGSMLLIFGLFQLSDYISVKTNQMPRFTYSSYYSSQIPDRILYKTLFYNVVRINPGTENEQIILVNRNSGGEQ